MSTKKNNLDQGLKDYLECEQMLGRLFSQVSFCTSKCISRKKSKYNLIAESSDQQSEFPGNVGCCPQDYFRFGNFLDAGDRALLEEKREQKYGLPSQNSSYCGYHTETGCKLPDHKAPLCISYLCEGFTKYLSDRFGIQYDGRKIEEDLELILAGKKSSKKVKDFKELITGFTVVVKN